MHDDGRIKACGVETHDIFIQAGSDIFYICTYKLIVLCVTSLQRWNDVLLEQIVAANGFPDSGCKENRVEGNLRLVCNRYGKIDQSELIVKLFNQ